ncbi:hypothetical protein Z043_124270, partial [Scleropages formosus]
EKHSSRRGYYTRALIPVDSLARGSHSGDRRAEPAAEVQTPLPRHSCRVRLACVEAQLCAEQGGRRVRAARLLVPVRAAVGLDRGAAPPSPRHADRRSGVRSASDYREDGMDLGSDASSRSSSESNSNKVTPCSEYKSSPSLDLVTLEDYEEDEDYQEYKKKVIEEWESEYGDCGDHEEGGGCRRPWASGGSAGTGGTVGTGGTGPLSSTRGEREEGGLGNALPAAEPQLPTMDWAALEKHLAGLQFQEQEVQNQNQGLGRTNYTSVSGSLLVRAQPRVLIPATCGLCGSIQSSVGRAPREPGRWSCSSPSAPVGD